MADRSTTRAVAELASRQHGVVGRDQLVALGVTRHQIGHRCTSGAWLPVRRGVYAIGHAPLTRRGFLMAAVLACGEGAALSHWSAAELWEVTLRRVDPPHVTIPATAARRPPGIVVHRRSRRGPISTIHGIPVTSPAQTLLDTASLAGRRATEKMIDQADRRRLCTYADFHALLASARGSRGAGLLRAVIAEHEAGSTVTRSQLEELFLALCRRERLPRPRVNAELQGLTVDFYWPEHLVAVETDGWSSHRPRERFQHDIDRGNRLLLAGILPLRFSYDDVARHSKATAIDLRRALRQGGPGLQGGRLAD